MKSTVEVLHEARALIEDPAAWGQGDGQCLRGTRCAAIAVWDVLARAGDYDSNGPECKALARAMGVEATFNIFAWNDSHTHADVLAAFDRAIAVEEARAQEFTVASEPVAVYA